MFQESSGHIHRVNRHMVGRNKRMQSVRRGHCGSSCMRGQQNSMIIHIRGDVLLYVNKQVCGV
jgi:hypothetical protein